MRLIGNNPRGMPQMPGFEPDQQIVLVQSQHVRARRPVRRQIDAMFRGRPHCVRVGRCARPCFNAAGDRGQPELPGNRLCKRAPADVPLADEDDPANARPLYTAVRPRAPELRDRIEVNRSCERALSATFTEIEQDHRQRPRFSSSGGAGDVTCSASATPAWVGVRCRTKGSFGSKARSESGYNRSARPYRDPTECRP